MTAPDHTLKPFKKPLAQIEGGSDCPFSWTDLSHDLCDRDSEGGVAVQNGDMNLELRRLTIKVSRHEALTQQVHAMYVGFDAASAVVAAPSIARQAHPQDAAESGY